MVGKEVTTTVENRLGALVDQEFEQILFFDAEDRLNLNKQYPSSKDIKKILNLAFD